MAGRTQEQEPRYGCPVCLGVIMAKVAPSKDVDVQLDYCTRCGGMWLDQGEAEQLKMCRPKALSSVIELSKSAYLMKCHSCQATMDRNEEKCSTCGEKNVISCPVCARQLRRVEKDEVSLDVCSHCKGVWFDNTELASLWNRTVSSTGKGTQPTTHTGNSFLDVVLLDPDIGPSFDIAGAAGSVVEGAADLAGFLVEGAAHAAGSIVGGAADAASAIVGGAGEVAGGDDAVAEGAAEVGGAFFEVVGGILGSLGDLDS